MLLSKSGMFVILLLTDSWLVTCGFVCAFFCESVIYRLITAICIRYRLIFVMLSFVVFLFPSFFSQLSMKLNVWICDTGNVGFPF